MRKHDVLDHFNSKQRADHDQDVRAMQHARTWDAVVSVALAMQGLGRWTSRAHRVFLNAHKRFSGTARDHDVLRVLGESIPQSVSHGNGTSKDANA